MKNTKGTKIDYLFEVSWEVCNKISGKYTAISTKCPVIEKEIKNHILVGPDVVHEGKNGYFIEDQSLMRQWRIKANQDGLHVRVGHWNIESKPVAILIDFTPYFWQKDDIFKELWETYKVDSLNGQWDYIEPTLFGYASGKVIEHFINFYLSNKAKITAHFHDWTTGAGLLYLRQHVPQVGCVFTAHSTVVGRCIATNENLYENIDKFNADSEAAKYNVTSKHSLEKIAANTADCFTVISEPIRQECKYFLGKEAGIITPNGFDTNIIKSNDKKSAEGAKILRTVAETLLHTKLDKAMLVGMSGRYEVKNKGIDIFIEMLGKLNKDNNLKRQVVAFINVPTAQHGPNKELLQNLTNKNWDAPITDKFLTHYLVEPENDEILKLIQKAGLNNSEKDKVKVVYAPLYLTGDDGIFNVKYYDLLVGMDITVFPSYYEPWGYTPLESLAFGVPTISTSLTGFGIWVKDHYQDEHKAFTIIERNDTNNEQVISEMENALISFSTLTKKELDNLRANAKDVAAIAIWKNFIKYYMESYENSQDNVAERRNEIMEQPQEDTVSYIDKQSSYERPSWTDVIVQRSIPPKLAALDEISKNLWWCWNQRAIELFKYIDNDTFTKLERNPIALLDTISMERYQELEKDEEFTSNLQAVHKSLKEYMNKKKQVQKNPKIAYFSMEYGLQASLKIYSGGLGILAGDYLKEASDMNKNLCAVGLLYRYGYFKQKLSAAGDQVAEYEAQDFTKIPATPVRDSEGNWLTATVAFPGRTVYIRIWKVAVGRIDLYLLDTDFEDNLPEDRTITHELYGGDWENRLKQELVLGVGGIRALNIIGVKDIDVYHCNEGHAAFIGLERIRELVVDQNLTFLEAVEVVRSSSLFTTHTPVPAGHDAFEENLLRKYIAHYPERLGISWNYLMGIGKIDPNDQNEKFSMSFLAANLSQEINGVSWLHGKVSREIFRNMWSGYLPEELHIGYVTNGVHLPTWASPQWKEIFEKNFGEKFNTHNYDKKCFEKIFDIDDKRIWEIRRELKTNLVEHIRKRLASKENIVQHTPQQIVQISKILDANKLTIGFARRFATYKRAHLLFKNIDRLDQIVNNPEHPVQFLFAGKAHPADKAGQDLIKMIVEYSKMPQFMGKIIFLDNYDMELARRMVQGVDIWMNTPTRPQEASGTSGEKAVLNGVMHFSVLDGWWVEGYRPDAGWCLPMERTYENQDFQDQMDSELIYNTIENEIAPLYYKRNKLDIPVDWVERIKNSIAYVASNFTTNRMYNDYEERFYNKLTKRHESLIKNDYAKAREIAEWKKIVSREWDNIQVVSTNRVDITKGSIVLGKKYDAEVVLNVGILNPEDIGVEVVFAENKNGKTEFIDTQEFKITKTDGNIVTYSTKLEMTRPGSLLITYRVFPKNSQLPHRQDFGIVKWI